MQHISPRIFSYLFSLKNVLLFSVLWQNTHEISKEIKERRLYVRSHFEGIGLHDGQGMNSLPHFTYSQESERSAEAHPTL